MSEAPLMNDEAARSTTGEILDQSTPATTTTPTTTTPENTASTTTTPADPAAAEGGSAKPPTDPAKPPTTGAPETYADFKVPEGYTLASEALETALPAFKELGLTQDQAQKLVDIQIARELAIAKAPADAYAATRREWQTSTLSDPEIKAVGIDSVKADIGRALTQLPADLSADFRKAMDITGAGDHPAFVKAMWKLSQFVAEGKHVAGAGPSPAGQTAPGAKPPSAARAMYPNLK